MNRISASKFKGLMIKDDIYGEYMKGNKFALKNEEASKSNERAIQTYYFTYNFFFLFLRTVEKSKSVMQNMT